jgi:hypothetical protein
MRTAYHNQLHNSIIYATLNNAAVAGNTRSLPRRRSRDGRLSITTRLVIDVTDKNDF